MLAAGSPKIGWKIGRPLRRGCVAATGQGRLGDKASVVADSHGCPACPHPGVGPAIVGSTDVIVNSRPALRVGDKGMHAACCGTNSWTAKAGALSVFINGKAAFRKTDPTQHCGGIGRLIGGSSNVIVGNLTSAGTGPSNGNGGRSPGEGGGGGAGGSSTATAGRDASPPPPRISEPVEPRKITLHGVFKHDNRAIGETRFTLRRNTASGAAVTPETLEGGQTRNPYRDGFWIADAGGEYRFTEMPAFAYFVIPELGVRGESTAPEALPELDTCGAEGGPEGVIWVALFDDSMERRLVTAGYRIQLDDDTELSGTTDEHGELRHERVATGMYTITVGAGEGTVPARQARLAAAAYGVRICGAEAAG